MSKIENKEWNEREIIKEREGEEEEKEEERILTQMQAGWIV